MTRLVWIPFLAASATLGSCSPTPVLETLDAQWDATAGPDAKADAHSGADAAPDARVDAAEPDASTCTPGEQRDCGTCGTQTCQDDQTWGPCVEFCEGRECGDTPCGGSCGSCAPNLRCNAQGRCESITILMTDYWPIGVSKIYRRADGSLYLQQVHDPAEPYQAQMPQKNGSTYWRLHDYRVLDPRDGPDKLVYLDTWHMRSSPDGQVAEVADNFADDPIQNGTFDTDTHGWIVGRATASVQGGQVTVTSGPNGYGYLSQAIATTPGERYAISARAKVGTAAQVHLRAGTSEAGYDLGDVATSASSMTKLRLFFVATSNVTYVTLINSGEPGGTGVYDDVHWWYTKPTYTHTAYYYDDVIGHGRPGGHVVGETSAYEQWNIDYWWGPNDAPPRPPDPPTYTRWAYSSVRVLEYYETYRPPYGNSGSGFGAGRAPVYHDVIRVRFQHGTASGDPHCPNQPAQFPHVPGYASYWADIYLAPGVGKIEQHILWYEPNGTCDGDALHPGLWAFYLDEIQ